MVKLELRTRIEGLYMEYIILTAVGQETPSGNSGFELLEKQVNEHISKGWQPVGGVSVAPVVGPKLGAQRDNWFTRFTQAMIRTD